MKPSLRLRLSAALLLVPSAASCGDDPSEARARTGDGSGRPQVATTFFPTTWLVRELAGDAVEIVYPLPPGEDPIFWQPSREDLARYQVADLIVVNGAELEKWVHGASLPSSRVLDSARRFRAQWREVEEVTHSHGGGGEHSHHGVDGHTWLSPALFEQQAVAIAEALQTRGLAPKDEVERAMGEIRTALRRLGATFRDEIVPLAEGVRVLANHSAYDYLMADALDLVNLDLDPADTTADAALAAVRAACGDGTRCILLWESTPNGVIEAALRDELGVPSVLFSPAENVVDADADYVAIQRANLDRLRTTLEGL